MFRCFAVALLLSCCLAAGWSAGSSACVFVIQPEETRIKFRVGHNDYVSPIKGRFDSVSGTISYQTVAERPALQVDVVIDADSVNTANRFRDHHLRSAFFETDRFPQIHFRAQAMDLERNVVLGELTIKDVTHPVELKVMAVREYLDEVGAKMLRCRAIGTVNRRTFGVAEDASRSEGLARFIAEIQEGLDEFIEDDVEISVHVVARAN